VSLNLTYLLATGAGNHAEQAQNGAMILVQLAVIATGTGRGQDWTPCFLRPDGVPRAYRR
jgi:hypothetical protein